MLLRLRCLLLVLLVLLGTCYTARGARLLRQGLQASYGGASGGYGGGSGTSSTGGGAGGGAGSGGGSAGSAGLLAEPAGQRVATTTSSDPQSAAQQTGVAPLPQQVSGYPFPGVPVLQQAPPAQQLPPGQALPPSAAGPSPPIPLPQGQKMLTGAALAAAVLGAQQSPPAAPVPPPPSTQLLPPPPPPASPGGSPLQPGGPGSSVPQNPPGSQGSSAPPGSPGSPDPPPGPPSAPSAPSGAQVLHPFEVGDQPSFLRQSVWTVNCVWNWRGRKGLRDCCSLWPGGWSAARLVAACHCHAAVHSRCTVGINTAHPPDSSRSLSPHPTEGLRHRLTPHSQNRGW